MKPTNALSLAILLAALPPAGAQAPAPSPEDVRAIAAEARLQEITQRMTELDGAIEQQVQQIAEFLSGIKDSPDSRSRVSQMKKDFIQNLKKSIDVYQRLRNDRLQELGRPGVANTGQSLTILDEKIDTRVDQILEVAKSFSESDGMREYEYFYDDDGGATRLESDTSRQNRREGSRAGQVEDRVIEGLEAAIRDDEQRRQTLENRLSWAGTAEEKKALQDQMAEIDRTIETRRGQIRELLTERESADQALDSREAFALDQQLDDQMQALKKMFQELYSLAAERRNELQRIKALQGGSGRE